MILLSVFWYWLAAVIGALFAIFILALCRAAANYDEPRLNHWYRNFDGGQIGFDEEEVYN